MNLPVSSCCASRSGAGTRWCFCSCVPASGSPTASSAGSSAGAFDIARPYINIALDEISRQIVVEELERTYFMPRITDVYDIHDDLGVVSWEVATDKGDRSFHVRNIRQNVRKMGRRRLVIRDVDGNRYEIRDWARPPAPPEKLLEPYL